MPAPALPALPSTEGTRGPLRGSRAALSRPARLQTQPGRQGSLVLVQGTFSPSQPPVCIRASLFLVSPVTCVHRSVPLPGVSLPDVSLPGVPLPGVPLPGVSLPGVPLPGVSLPGVPLPGVSIHRA